MSPAPDAGAPATPIVPSLRRRFLSAVYESVLLTGVVLVAGAAGYVIQVALARYALPLRPLGQVAMFALVGLYFVHFWTHGGQTLAMSTWRIRVVGPDGGPLTTRRAIARYLLLWLFLVPTLAILAATSAGHAAIVASLAAAILLPPCYALFDRDRQFLHDRLLGTRLVTAT